MDTGFIILALYVSWRIGKCKPASSSYSPPKVDRIWLWVYYNKTPPYTPYSIYLRGTIARKFCSQLRGVLSLCNLYRLYVQLIKEIREGLFLFGVCGLQSTSRDSLSFAATSETMIGMQCRRVISTKGCRNSCKRAFLSWKSGHRFPLYAECCEPPMAIWPSRLSC